MKRQVYLALKSIEEAREILLSRAGTGKRTGIEEIPAEVSLGRVTAEPLFARISSPSYHASAMDGVAVRAEETYGVNERNPKILEIGGDALWINTGHAIPEGFNAVIMVEKVHQVDDVHLEIRAPSYPWQHVRKVGEDIVATQLLLPQNHRIRPYDLGAIISAGIFTLKVWERPKAVIIPTGSELVQPKDVVSSGGLKKN
ncbi:MAG: molybdopterin biosynthesis protein, partial [Pseudomonadota bacterium]